jgi:hypothetical protein
MTEKFSKGDKVTVKGNPIVGEVTAIGGNGIGGGIGKEGKICVKRPNPNGGSNMTHWVKVERVVLVERGGAS